MSAHSPVSEAPALTPSALHVKCQSPELYLLNPGEDYAHSLFPAQSHSHLTMPFLSSADFQKTFLPSLTFESSTVGVVGEQANVVDTQLRSSMTATALFDVYCEKEEVYNFSSGGWRGKEGKNSVERVWKPEWGKFDGSDGWEGVQGMKGPLFSFNIAAS